MISFQDFKKMELKAARIEAVEDIEGKDKLYLIKIDVGSEKKQIVAGVKGFYSKQELEGKTIAVVNNLEPANIAGIKSEAMLLAAVQDAGKKITVLFLDDSIPAGTSIE